MRPPRCSLIWVDHGGLPTGGLVCDHSENCKVSISPGDWEMVLKRGGEVPPGTFQKES